MQRQHHAQFWAWIFSVLISSSLFGGVAAWMIWGYPLLSSEVSLAAKNTLDDSDDEDGSAEADNDDDSDLASADLHDKGDEAADDDEQDDDADSEPNHSIDSKSSHDCTDALETKLNSPVDLQKRDIKYADLASPLELHFVPSNFKHKGENHTTSIEWAPGNFLRVQGREYQLQSMTFVSPSDHRVFGADFASELQFRLADQQRNVAMLSVLIKIGKAHPELEKLINEMRRQSSEEEKNSSEDSNIDVARLFPNSGNYYQYVGTDPNFSQNKCAESAIWHIMKAPIVASEDQVSFLLTISRKPLSIQKPADLMIWYNDVDANKVE